MSFDMSRVLVRKTNSLTTCPLYTSRPFIPSPLIPSIHPRTSKDKEGAKKVLESPTQLEWFQNLLPEVEGLL